MPGILDFVIHYIVLPMLIKYGPQWVIELLPKMPQWIQKVLASDLAKSIIADLIKAFNNPKASNSAARKMAANKLKSCTVGCAPETK